MIVTFGRFGMFSCLFLVVFCCVSSGAEDNLLKRARRCDKFDEKGYDRDKAISLYQEFLKKNPEVHLSKRLKVLHRMAQLYSYAAKPKEEDPDQAVQYYNKMLELAGNRINRDILFAKSNLPSLQAEDSAEAARRYLQFYLWTMRELVAPQRMMSRIIYPKGATDAERKKYAREIIDLMIRLQNSKARKLENRLQESESQSLRRFVHKMTVSLLATTIDIDKNNTRRLTDSEHIKSAISERFGNDGASSQPAQSDKHRGRADDKQKEEKGKRSRSTIEEISAEDLKEKKLAQLKQQRKWIKENEEDYKKKEKILVNIRKLRKWVEKHPDKFKRLKIFAKRYETTLRKTEEGKAKALKWLKAHRSLWKSSPYEPEFRRLMDKAQRGK